MEIKKNRIELKLNDQTSLFGRAWTVEKSVANVIIMEGMEEHATRYDDFASYLCSKGIDVYCIDTYGQGENVNPDMSNLGVWPESGFRKMVQATDQLVAKLRVSWHPIYIFAHSMGSFMAQDYIQRYTEHVSKVVLCGSGAKNPATEIGFALAKLTTTKKNRNDKSHLLNKLMFGNFNRHIQNPKTPFDWLSYNEENVVDYIADPLDGFGPTKGFCYEFLKGMRRLYKHKFLKKIKKDLKLFIISGADDPVSNFGHDVGRLKNMYKKLGLEHVHTKIYKDARHEILNESEPIKKEVYKDIADFFLGE
ncbi:MAG: alpha/beta hydrolase [Erysipelotrichaceae bacterium]|jgi:alpha-beta hydrolase superfamily lysophospholipase|nr:alpha/beta hydrolase [Erysipelotrichaceae bacterium]